MAVGSEEDAYLLEAWPYTDSKLSLQLRKFAIHPDDENRLGELSEPLWFFSFPISLEPEKLIPTILPQLEAASHKEILEVAQVCNFTGSPNRWIDTGTLPEAIEANLQEMDLVAQSLAVRDLHRLMREEGESPESLGAIVRGYAHLCVLTRHYWGYTSEVFSARALLYAERLVARNRDATIGRWHRAYAAALSGCHAFALEDLDWIAQQPEGSGNDVPAPWCRLIAPVCKYDLDSLHSLAGEEPSIEQAAHVLSFDAANAQGDIQLSQAVGMDTLEYAPGDLGVYYRLGSASALRMQRWSARATPLAIANTFLFVCSARAGIPDAIKELAGKYVDVVGDAANDSAQLLDVGSGLIYSVRRISELLREADTTTAIHGLPWRNIAFLVDEELFLMVVGQLENASNAVESDLRDQVEALLPLVKGHRYAPYVESFAFNKSTEQAARRSTLDRLKPGYTRWHMESFRSAVFYHSSPDVSKGFTDLMTREHFAHDLEYAFSNYTTSTKTQEKIAKELRAVSPHSPYALQYTISTSSDADSVQLKKWEVEAENNFQAMHALSQHYLSKALVPDAIRCLERALALRQEETAFKQLADIYWRQNEVEKWELTWNRFLETPPMGLEHVDAHTELAYGLIWLNRLDEALKHGLEAAKPYSAMGLQVAAVCYEARKEYDEAHLWWQRLSEFYGGESRFEWYLFCRRTGHGDVAAALQMARKYADEVQRDDKSNHAIDVALVEMMDGSTGRAAEIMRSEFEKRHESWYLAHLALLALRSDDTEVRQSTLDELTNLLAQVDDAAGGSGVYSRISPTN